MATKKTTAKKVHSTITPLADRVLLKPYSAEAARAEAIGLQLAGTDTHNTSQGTVIAVGDGRLDTETGKRIPVSVAKNDIVLFQFGEKVDVDGEEYYIVSESNILAVVE